jgi:poly-gamma-glutamate synthesis protein (capsule biosynthesis protein)
VRRRTTVGSAIAIGVAFLAVSGLAVSPGGPVATPGRAAVRLERQPPTLTIIAGGDVLTESQVRAAAARHGAATGMRFDFAPVFAPVQRIVSSANLAICHMELPIGVPGGPYGYFGRSPYGGNQMLAPYEIATGLQATGFDRCSTASNHSYDVGTGGIATTIAALADHGIDSVGTATTPAASGPDHLTVDDIRVAHVSFTNHSNTVPPSDSWRLNITKDAAVIAGQVAGARRAGAEIVILSLHVSQELLAAPTPADRALVTAVVRAAPVDAVVMHGPHVVQPFELVNGTPVWWSLGNFVSEMGLPHTGRYAHPRTSDGLLAFLRFTRRSDGTFARETATIAICNDVADRTVRAATTDLRRSDLSARVRSDLEACLARTRTVVPDAR